MFKNILKTLEAEIHKIFLNIKEHSASSQKLDVFIWKRVHTQKKQFQSSQIPLQTLQTPLILSTVTENKSQSKAQNKDYFLSW